MAKRLIKVSFLGTQLCTCQTLEVCDTFVAGRWFQCLLLSLLVSSKVKLRVRQQVDSFIYSLPAHCVTHEKTKRSINSNKVLVYLGKTNLQKWTGPEQDAKVEEIIVHSEYDPERFYSDIAILKLKDALTKTNYVRPICLWNLETDLKMIVNKLGSVPGW